MLRHIFFAITTLISLVLAIVSPVLAQTSGFMCRTGNVLTPEEIVEESAVKHRADQFSSVMLGARVGGSRQIGHVLTYCSKESPAIAVGKLSDEADRGKVPQRKSYGVYVPKLFFVKHTDDDDIARTVRKVVCVVRSGEADVARQVIDNIDTLPIRECMRDEALAAGDHEYAKHLRVYPAYTAEDVRDALMIAIGRFLTRFK